MVIILRLKVVFVIHYVRAHSFMFSFKHPCQQKRKKKTWAMITFGLKVQWESHWEGLCWHFSSEEATGLFNMVSLYEPNRKGKCRFIRVMRWQTAEGSRGLCPLFSPSALMLTLKPSADPQNIRSSFARRLILPLFLPLFSFLPQHAFSSVHEWLLLIFMMFFSPLAGVLV